MCSRLGARLALHFFLLPLLPRQQLSEGEMEPARPTYSCLTTWLVCQDEPARDGHPRYYSSRPWNTLRTAQALTAVQAFVAGPIADGDVTAIRTGWRVL